MPEIRNTFIAGKMNKDLDERLIPNGQYRDAMNIQVSTSEGSDIGAIQNILGNSKIDRHFTLGYNAVCISSISDEKTDSLYYFVTSDTKDMILRFKNSTITPVFVDLRKDVLHFNPNGIITGINVVNDMLFWTDDITEPKKINIDNCIEGTKNTGDEHTKVINPSQGIVFDDNMDMLEEHITVIKKAPKYPPTISYTTFRDPSKKYTGIMKISSGANIPSSFISSSQGITTHDFGTLGVGDTFRTIIETDISGSDWFNLDWEPGSVVVLKEFPFSGDTPIIPISNYKIKGVITNWEHNNFSNANLIVNKNHSFTYGTGTAADWKYYTSQWDWDGANMEALGIQHKVLATTITENGGGDANVGDVYKVTFTVGGPRDGSPLQGRIWVTFHDKDNNYTTRFSSWNALSAGTHSETFTVDTSWIAWPWGGPPGGGALSNHIVFHQKEETTGNGIWFNGTIDNVYVEKVDAGEQAQVEIKITSIDGTPESVNTNYGDYLNYAIDKFDPQDKLFPLKFPRFAYRYKYRDGEYSTFSPFSEVGFVPSSFDYHPTEGYNLGMQNSIKTLKLSDFQLEAPKDVISIDILYKEESSPNIYIVDTVRHFTSRWTSYTITSETIRNGTVPSNQLIRLWDNVPRKALAQDVVGNRIVYGNYLQNYDLVDSVKNTDYNIKLNPSIISEPHTTGIGKKSIKSLREYQLGVVYVDEYGRETPVQTNSLATVKTSKDHAYDMNRFQISINSEGHPVNMKYFKFYVKETAGEYYNLAMDRFYDAKDDNIWLSFPSSERNKLDIDDYLILKKGLGNVGPVSDDAKYKVLDIRNEAPDFIKRKESLVFKKVHEDGSVNLFDDSDLPTENSTTFTVNYAAIARNSISHLHEELNGLVKEEYYISLNNIVTKQVSKRYKISALGVDDAFDYWYFTVDEPFGSEINDFTNDPTGNNPTKMLDFTYLNIYKSFIDIGAEFDGRFFVKIYNDDIFKANIVESIDDGDIEYKTVASRKIYSLATNTSYTLDRRLLPLSNCYLHAFKDIDSNLGTNGLHANAIDAASFANVGGPVDGLMPAHAPYNGGSYLKNWASYAYATDSAFANWGSAWLLGHTEEAWQAAAPPIRTAIETRGAEDSLAFGRDLWTMYDAFFRGINVDLHGGGNYRSSFPSDRVENMEIHPASTGGNNNAWDQSFEDVWFIDKANSSGNFHYSGNAENLGWSTDPINIGDGEWSRASTGLQSWDDSSRIELGFGGIQPAGGWPMGQYDGYRYSNAATGGVIEGFGIGDAFKDIFDPSFYDLMDTNVNYSATQKDFIKHIAVGSKMKFKEDPSNTIYTIEDVEIILRARYEAFTMEDPMGKVWGEDFDNGLGGSYRYPVNYVQDQINSTLGYSPNHDPNHHDHTGTGLDTQPWTLTDQERMGFYTSAYFRPSNFTKNWRIKLNKPIAWNPVANTGGVEIAGGKYVKLQASANNIAGNAKSCEVANLDGITAAGASEDRLEVGMVLKAIGSNVLDPPAIVSKIEGTDATGYVIYFKTYDGTPDLAHSNAAATDIDEINSGDVLHFYHFPMNGLSKNTAKNLNYFRQGVSWSGSNLAGTDAVGYTIEFVESDISTFSIPGEQTMPTNPAIWESEPKDPVADLDIYYEMTGLLPISLDSSNFENVIPVGSIIELENSNVIPFGTSITYIDPETGWIKLSREVEVETIQSTGNVPSPTAPPPVI